MLDPEKYEEEESFLKGYFDDHNIPEDNPCRVLINTMDELRKLNIKLIDFYYTLGEKLASKTKADNEEMIDQFARICIEQDELLGNLLNNKAQFENNIETLITKIRLGVENESEPEREEVRTGNILQFKRRIQ